jgi:hypothetical protein
MQHMHISVLALKYAAKLGWKTRAMQFLHSRMVKARWYGKAAAQAGSLRAAIHMGPGLTNLLRHCCF